MQLNKMHLLEPNVHVNEMMYCEQVEYNSEHILSNLY